METAAKRITLFTSAIICVRQCLSLLAHTLPRARYVTEVDWIVTHARRAWRAPPVGDHRSRLDVRSQFGQARGNVSERGWAATWPSRKAQLPLPRSLSPLGAL